VFISIHSNGSPDASERGVEVWYDEHREFGAENAHLAGLLQSHVLRELAAYGYDARDRGLKEDTCFRMRFGRCFALFVLGPERRTTRSELNARGVAPETLGLSPQQEVYVSRATAMPGALVELLFISNAADAAVLADAAGRDALARGVAAAVREFLAARPR
jgi:N-acetylmuramoyl-L-alanine amidase